METNEPRREEQDAEFEFEAFVVGQSDTSPRTPSLRKKLWRAGNKAQMVWKPGNDDVRYGAFTEDLRRSTAAKPNDNARSCCDAKVAPGTQRHEGRVLRERATIEKVTSITDSLGRSRGSTG